MGKYTVSVRSGTLKIKCVDADGNKQELQVVVDELEPQKKYKSEWIIDSAEAYKILYAAQLKGSDETIVVVTGGEHVWYWRWTDTLQSPLRHLVEVRSKVLGIRLTHRGLRMVYVCLILNRYGLAIKQRRFLLDEENVRPAHYPVVTTPPSRIGLLRHLYTAFFPMKDMLTGEPPINSTPKVELEINGELASYALYKRQKLLRKKRYYYAPIAATRSDEFAIHVRRTAGGAMTVVRRHLEAIERTRKFRLLESVPISFTLFWAGRIVRFMSPMRVNIYFEKFAFKAEEGAYDAFLQASRVGGSRNFFIINKESPDYVPIMKVKDVVANFTLKSYWLIYRSNAIIATEAPAQVNVVRPNNKYLRRGLFLKKFIFLQHGVIYMKNLGKRSPYSVGRDGEPDYMVVASEKERQVSAEMLGLEPERMLKVGQPFFDKISYNHIDAKSKDIATVMLTWKPYEEHLTDFSKSTYYQYTVAVYELLVSLMPAVNVRIVAHPKALQQLSKTDLRSSIWSGPISEALRDSKLLITDYSSVCYNSFYQGGAVIFYQPDIKNYERENGRLIPKPEEYIGERAFSEKDLKAILKGAIKQGCVDLERLRTAEHVKNYSSIVEFHDGRNVERLCIELQRMGIV